MGLNSAFKRLKWSNLSNLRILTIQGAKFESRVENGPHSQMLSAFFLLSPRQDTTYFKVGHDCFFLHSYQLTNNRQPNIRPYIAPRFWEGHQIKYKITSLNRVLLENARRSSAS